MFDFVRGFCFDISGVAYSDNSRKVIDSVISLMVGSICVHFSLC